MKRIKALTVFGTRPEAIKMAPLVLELKRRESEFDCAVCVTAQHREMLDSVLSRFDITPDYDLDIMRENQTVSEITSRVLKRMGAVLRECRPDVVLVHGDTTTALSSALAAFYEKLLIGHVEAGLRTYDRYSPYPEEMNRRLLGSLAQFHFAPTKGNAGNLRREGVSEGVFITGNTVIDALRHTSRFNVQIPALDGLDFTNKRVIVLTCHRRENYGAPMENIFRAVRRLAEDFPDTEMVYPVHMSPAVKDSASRHLSGVPGVRLIEPLDAFEMHALISKCYMALTDSGGIQEEAPAFGKPVVVLRRETERPEAIEAGTAVLAGVDENEVYAAAARLLRDEAAYTAMAKAVNPYGDGTASAKIADALAGYFNN